MEYHWITEESVSDDAAGAGDQDHAIPERIEGVVVTMQRLEDWSLEG
jgi:hypothetical protein